MTFGDRKHPIPRTPFKRKAPANTARKPRTPVKQVATRRRSEEAEYRELRAELLSTDAKGQMPMCVAGDALFVQGVQVCTGRATELHHRRKRSSAGALANPDNVVPCCHECNMAIEHYPMAALAAGLVIREGHPEWSALSARAWRKR